MFSVAVCFAGEDQSFYLKVVLVKRKNIKSFPLLFCRQNNIVQPNTNAHLEIVRLRGIHLIGCNLGEGEGIKASHAE